MKADEIQNLIHELNRRKTWLDLNSYCRSVPPIESHIDHEDLESIHTGVRLTLPCFLKSPDPEMQDVTVSRMKRAENGFAWISDPDLPPEVIGSVPSWFTAWTLSKAAAAFPESFILRLKHSPIEHWENFVFQSKELIDQMIWRPIVSKDFQIFVTTRERTGEEETETRRLQDFYDPINQSGSIEFQNTAYQENPWTSQIVKSELTETCSFMEIKSRFTKFPIEIVFYLRINPWFRSDSGYYSDFGECTVDYSIPQGIFADADPLSGQTFVNPYAPAAYVLNSLQNARYLTITHRLEPGESLTVGQTEFNDFGVPETLNSLLAEAEKDYPDQLSIQCSGGNSWIYLCGRYRVLY